MNEDPKFVTLLLPHIQMLPVLPGGVDSVLSVSIFGVELKVRKDEMRIKNRHDFRPQKFRKSISEVRVNKAG